MCEYCEKTAGIDEIIETGVCIWESEDGEFILYVFTGSGVGSVEGINFCPMCGRNLTEE